MTVNSRQTHIVTGTVLGLDSDPAALLLTRCLVARLDLRQSVVPSFLHVSEDVGVIA